MVDDIKTEVTVMDIYQCSLCGHVYDEEQGDYTQDVAPGTKFGDLPDDWVCPVCRAPKSDYIKK